MANKSNDNSKTKTASVLAFERKINVSDAVFFQQLEKGGKVPLVVSEKSVRGTISNRLNKASEMDPLKLNAEIEKANLQTVDTAMLDSDKDSAIVKWNCKVLPFTGQPAICNDNGYQQLLVEKIQEYIKEHGFTELARRYAHNIVNGRWLWRNRISAQSIKMDIKLDNDCADVEPKITSKSIAIDNAKSYSLRDFSSDHAKEVSTLAGWIAAGLSGERLIIFDVTATLKMGLGQEVYPSEELVLDKGQSGNKSKILYSKGDQAQAGMHSQKIGNAIRTIDTWYQSNAPFPIAIEPYGSVTTMGMAFRQPKQKQDFYTLFDDWILKSKKPEVDQQHYIVAMLIRGGVFGGSSKETNSKGE